MKSQILKEHENLNHRKSIQKNLLEKGLKVTKKEISNALEKCEIYVKKDKQYIKTGSYVEVENPGDRVGIDILELKKKDKIFVGIDYFSRKVFAKAIETKEAIKTVCFLEEM
jgi:hypothetical protein